MLSLIGGGTSRARRQKHKKSANEWVVVVKCQKDELDQ